MRKRSEKNKWGIILVVFLTISFLLAVFFIAKEKTKESQITEKVEVLQVVDGDTVKVKMIDKTETVRLIGIDAPETQGPKECFSEESKREAENVLSGKSVILVSDTSQDNRDKFGRILRYVFLENGENFNEYMIKNGFAEEYDFMGKYYRYRDNFEAAEKNARDNLSGLWRNCKGNENN